jgi:hypothetical protein
VDLQLAGDGELVAAGDPRGGRELAAARLHDDVVRAMEKAEEPPKPSP